LRDAEWMEGSVHKGLGDKRSWRARSAMRTMHATSGLFVKTSTSLVIGHKRETNYHMADIWKCDWRLRQLACTSLRME